MLYVPRLQKPDKSEKLLFSDENFFTKHGYPMNNCTTYCWGEWMRRVGKSIGCRGSAGGWIWEVGYRDLGWKISETPTLGAVGVWKIKGAKLDGVKTPGHVAMPEQIKNNADIITSNSAYKGTMFYLQELKAANNYYWKSNITGKEYECLGFIYPPINFTEEPTRLHTTAKLQFRKDPERPMERFEDVPSGAEFLYDGNFKIVKNTKWMRGIYDGSLGWVSGKFLVS